MQFECQVDFVTQRLKDKQDIQVQVLGPMHIVLNIEERRLYNVLAMRNQIVAGLNKELNRLVELHLGGMAKKEDEKNKLPENWEVGEPEDGR